MGVYEELKERGLLAQATDEKSERLTQQWQNSILYRV